LPRSLNEELARRRIEPDRIGRTESPGTTMAAYIPLILFTVLTNAAAQIMLKQGMLLLGTFEFTAAGIVATAPRVALNPFVILGLFTFVISMASHLLVLSRVDLSFCLPLSQPRLRGGGALRVLRVPRGRERLSGRGDRPDLPRHDPDLPQLDLRRRSAPSVARPTFTDY
jgi:hypothetical protein